MNRYISTNIFQWITGLLITLLLTGCGEEVQRSLRPVPTAFGKINQLVVIADQEVWDGPLGDTIRFYYSSAFPILPQPEPILDLSHFTVENLEADPLRKELRNYMLIANLEDESSLATRLVRNDVGQEKIRQAREEGKFNPIAGRDKWAKGQLLIYQFAPTEDELIETVKRNFPSVLKRVHEADENKIEATIYLDGESYKLKEEVREKMNVNLRVPNDYLLATSEDNFIWIRKETPKISSNIMIHKVKYTDQQQLTKEGIKKIRDSLGRKYISSTLPNTYMQINDVDLPLLTSETTIDGHYALEARGIWEIVNDYMGGAFISYLVHNSENGELVFLDGFVHAPGEDKRNSMQYLEFILNTLKI
jgi:hypothetical protein